MDASGTTSSRPLVELTTHPSPHPFLRRGLVARRPSDLPERALVTVAAPDGTVLGDAFWNGHSDIALRRLTRGDVRFDRAWLAAAVDAAVSLRERVPGLWAGTDALRIVHAEGDGLSGLVVDRFGDVLALELFSAGWLDWLDPLLEILHTRLGTAQHRVELSPRVARLEGVRPLRRTSPGCPERLKVREGEVRFHVDLRLGHKTGFFCDQRDNRRTLATWADDADVLDLCCCTGGFAVTAARLSAPRSVTAVDLDEQALAVARANANLNQVRVACVHADAFDWCRQIGAGERRFDVVVLDPPKFIPTRKDETTGRARYHDLNRLALGLLRPGGLLLTCSCSGLLPRDELLGLVRTAARKSGRTARLLASTGAGPDHPVLLECPEGEYLKALWMVVE